MKGQSVTSVTVGRTSRRNKVLGPNSGTEGSAVAGTPAVCTPTGGVKEKRVLLPSHHAQGAGWLLLWRRGPFNVTDAQGQISGSA